MPFIDSSGLVTDYERISLIFLKRIFHWDPFIHFLIKEKYLLWTTHVFILQDKTNEHETFSLKGPDVSDMLLHSVKVH